MRHRRRLVGGDQEYLRAVQYGDPSRLTARANLHIKYGTAPMAWHPWVVTQIGWPDSGDVLDVGCGPGWLWVNAAGDVPSGLRLGLTDVSSGMVTVARHRVQSLGKYARVHAEEADAQQLPFADAAFDVVVANHMLYHVPTPSRAIAELARVLRDDGVLMAATDGPRHLVELGEITTDLFGHEVMREAVEAFGSVTGLPTLRAFFDDVEWREYRDELHCTDPDDVVAYIASAPPGENASPAELEQLHAVVRASFDAAGGVFKVSKEAGLFLCRDPRSESL